MATATNLPATAVSGEILTAAYVNNLRGAFRVLQVVTATTTSTVALPNTTFVQVLTASITPQATTNKILIYANCPDMYKSTDQAGNGINVQLWKGASSIAYLGQDFLRTDDTQRQHGQFDAFYMDSPATTSATTYSIYMNNRTTGTCSFNFNGSVGSILLMEISA